MTPSKLFICIAYSLWVASLAGLRSADIIVENDEWRYFKGHSAPSAPDPNAWRETSFEDSLSSSVDTLPPVLVDVFPPPGAILLELREIEVVFDDNVQGVDAGDLWINGEPAEDMVEFSPRNYAFQFPPVPEGPVEVEWARDHGIRDLANSPNLFAGGDWGYVIDLTAPPAAVVISEFMADNQNGVRDEDGNREDWIEILNLGPASADLEGWTLTDDRFELRKWEFPRLTLEANEYLLVWASGKDRATPDEPLHTNFALAREGEALLLANAQGEVVSEFESNYPPQREDVSYGRDPVDPDLVGYYTVPTPGRPNSASGEGFAPDPVFSLEGGVFNQSTLSLEITASEGEIRYTVNGSTPTQSAALYNRPITIGQSQAVKARVFLEGLLPSRIVAHSYVLVESELEDFNTKLPIFILSTDGRSILQDRRVTASFVSIDPFRGRAAMRDRPSFQGLASVEIRGQTSSGFPKKPYNLEIIDPYGNDMEVSLAGLPAESDWALHNPYSDKTFMNNFLAFELHEEMGHYAVRRRHVEVFVDDSGGRLDYPRDYAGVYVLLEKIKIDNNRVDLSRLSPEDDEEPDITGGYIIKKDKNSPGDLNFSTSGGNGFPSQSLKYHEPKPREITRGQQDWIRGYLNRFEQSLYSSNWLNAQGESHYSHYIDVDSFVDYHWIVEFAKQIDGYRLSTYLSKDRGGKLKMEPIWDWNLSFGNANYLEGEFPQGWYHQLIGANDHLYLRRLIYGTPNAGRFNGDPDFNQRIADRWGELRDTVLDPGKVLARVDEIAALLDEAQERDFDRWPRLGSYVWPNPGFYTSPCNYQGIIAAMKDWIQGRHEWLDSLYLKAPSPNRPGGYITSGFELSMQSDEGIIYYTLDGADPRASGGAVSESAIRYTQDVRLDGNARLVARAYDSDQWSPPVQATYIESSAPIAVSEIMYHSGIEFQGANGDDELEYIELINDGGEAVDVSGYRFTDGVRFTFPEGAPIIVEPNERLVVVNNLEAFQAHYDSEGIQVIGDFSGSLDNGGETAVLTGNRGETVASIEYDDDPFPATDGLGFALVRDVSAQASGNSTSSRAWKTGSRIGGTPGAAEVPFPVIPVIWINEALTHTDDPLVDAIELYNPNPQPVDVGGWYLSDDFRAPKFRIPEGSVIPAGGYWVIDENTYGESEGSNEGFHLRSSGDELYLYSADAEGRLTGYAHGFEFGAALGGVSFGRHVSTEGVESFVAQREATLGQPNAGPGIGPVIISEVMYHPPDVFENGQYWDNAEREFVEIQNIGGVSVALFDSESPEKTWRLSEAVEFAFPPGQTIDPGERLVIVPFDPAADSRAATEFRSQYGIGSSVRLLGPFSGKLNNGGETVELIQPDAVRFYTVGTLETDVVLDAVEYRDRLPWPLAADGAGFSIHRKDPAGYGNDPASWNEGVPSPGSGFTTDDAPVITTHPQSQAAAPGASVVFQVETANSGTARYQWRRDDENLEGANGPTLTLENVATEIAGDYRAIVMTETASAVSAAATLTVGTPPQISKHPESAKVEIGSTVQLSVAAYSPTPMTIQWRRNGGSIAGANQAALIVDAVSSLQAGEYDAVIGNAAGKTVSAAAVIEIPVEDADGDGLPDAYEIANGLNPNDGQDARLDADGDAFSNLEEFIAGTDLNDPDSLLRIEGITWEDGIAFEFEAAPERSYSVLYRDDVEAAEWEVFLESVENTSSEPAIINVHQFDSSPVKGRYFRIVTPAVSTSGSPNSER